MRILNGICGCCIVVTSMVSLAQTRSSGQGKSLGDIARELRQKNATMSAQPRADAAPQSIANPTPAEPALKGPASVVKDPPELLEFTESIRLMLWKEDFAGLDKVADDLRQTKQRWPGGAWKLSTLYDALQDLSGGGASSDDQWQQHIARLQRWMKARPQSITSRVALANAYYEYAWEARGSGYANSVTDQGWQLFKERLQQAGQTLVDAAELPAKCPQWYFVMQKVTVASSGGKERARSVFEKAIEFEPDYLGYYRLLAWDLQTKWDGEPGDIGAFANESYRRVGGKKGAVIYFEIASSLCNYCGDFSADEFSWPKLKEGFAALQELYGLSPLRVNRFAYLAVTYQDKAAAAQAFERISDTPDLSVWGTRARFDAHRAWAGVESAKTDQAKPAFQVSQQTTQRIAEMMNDANNAGNERRWKDADTLLQQVIDLATPLPGQEVWVIQAYMMRARHEGLQGHTKEAQVLLDQVVTITSEKSGPTSPETALALEQTAMFHRQFHDDAAAEQNLKRAIKIRELSSGASSNEALMDSTFIADIAHHAGRNQEAVSLLTTVIKARESAGQKGSTLVWPLDALAMTYQDMGQLTDAEATFVRLIGLMESFLPPNSIELGSPIERLAALYRVMGRQDDANRMQARLQAIQHPPQNSK